MSSLIMFATLLFLVNVHIGYCNRARELEFSRITKYELIDFVNPESFQFTKTIEFDAFNQHYIVELEEIEHMNPAFLRHANIKTSDHAPDGTFYTSLTKSCHYYGAVANDEGASTVIVSLCPNQGVRADITAFNQTIHIKPSAYYLDLEKDKQGLHRFSDQHLVYKSSDFDTTNEYLDRKHFSPPPSETSKTRRLITYNITSYNNGTNEVEIFLLNGPVRTLYYQHNYANWYEQLVLDLQSIFAKINLAYQVTQWGLPIGTMSIHLTEIEVIFDYVGRHSELKPPFRTDRCSYEASGGEIKAKCCSEGDAYDGICTVSADGYIANIEQWCIDYKSPPTYDSVMMLDNQPLRVDGGNTFKIGEGTYYGVCNENGVAIVSDGHLMWGWDDNEPAVTLAHELGHNFGMKHDRIDNNGCDEEYWVMGDGEVTAGFSNCSVKELLEYFQDKGEGLSCLGDGYHTWTNYKDLPSNYDPDNDSAVVPPDDPMSPIDVEGVKIWEDSMSFYFQHWSRTSSVHVAQVPGGDLCRSLRCVKIYQHFNDTRKTDYITRSTSLKQNYTSLILGFDVILNNMEDDNYCTVSYRFDNKDWVINEYQGGEDTPMYNQQIWIEGDSSASSIEVKLETDGNSGDGDDYCYYDNVYLYGSDNTVPPTDAPTTSTPTTDHPTSAPTIILDDEFSPVPNVYGDELWQDDMSDYTQHWSLTDSASQISGGDLCRSSSCVKISGYSDESKQDYIIRSTSVSSKFVAYVVGFDVILDNMEDDNHCTVSYRFDNDTFSNIETYDGDDDEDDPVQKYIEQFQIRGDTSANTLDIKLATDGDSGSGNDFCIYDNVYLYGKLGSATTTTTTITTTTTTTKTITTTTNTCATDDGMSSIPYVDGQELWHDPMDDFTQHWSLTDSASQISDEDICRSSNCVKISGHDDESEHDYIIRSTTLSQQFGAYVVGFDVILDNMEDDNHCKVSYRFDDDTFSNIETYDGDDDDDDPVQNYKEQFEILGVISANTLDIKLETDGDSESGNDFCIYDNVYLYGYSGTSGDSVATTADTTTITTTTDATTTTITTTSIPDEMSSIPYIDAQELWQDAMDDFAQNWSFTDSASQISDDDLCRSSKCVKISGHDDDSKQDYIIRSTLLTETFGTYIVGFDVILDNMEVGNECKVSYRFDNDAFSGIGIYDGDGSVIQKYNEQFAISIPGDTSAHTLDIKLETDGDSEDGNDFCIYDNVYLFGTDNAVVSSGSNGITCETDGYNYQCIEIYGMRTDLNDEVHDGPFVAQGCFDGKVYYTNEVGRYLCYKESKERWVITASLCDYSNYLVRCKTDGADIDIIRECENNWKVHTASEKWRSCDDVITQSCLLSTYSDSIFIVVE